jgi:hypothetical protein
MIIGDILKNNLMHLLIKIVGVKNINEIFTKSNAYIAQ